MDSYVEGRYFGLVKRLVELVAQGTANRMLMGISGLGGRFFFAVIKFWMLEVQAA